MAEWFEIIVPVGAADVDDVAALIASDVGAAAAGTEQRGDEIVFWVDATQVASALAETRDAVARWAAGAGRTYGRPWIFHLQTLLACGPLSLALVLNGSPYYIGLGLLNVLFFVGLKHITTSLQKIFVRALIAREREGGVVPVIKALRAYAQGVAQAEVARVTPRLGPMGVQGSYSKVRLLPIGLVVEGDLLVRRDLDRLELRL